jgi:hypothetical protein
MEAKDLMVGNYVNAYTGLLSYQFHKIQPIDIDDLEAGNLIIEPIPLTEEWLVKFGFERSEESLCWSLDGFLFEYLDNKIFPIFNRREYCLKHVHQLQNLYKALTGEELTIKQSPPCV